MNRGTMSTEVRALLNEPATSFYSVAEINRWLDRGCEIVVGRTESVEDNYSFSGVKYQGEYSLPSKCLKVKAIFWEDEPLTPISWKKYLWYVAREDHDNTGDPKHYVKWNKKAYLYPKPSSSATATTVDGDHTA